ncbi:DUF1336 hypothetical protein [Helicosporidium sp. ATCC 50920]|nr:DUF1336 hypothetical protein [Helicosporidium sp. ATCC 50920]|eukprot:KDD74455.1 DUF1336 hypothetical protein [Helicosporidium sp. ATCC 50920]
MWECPGAAGLRVRGASYLADRVKVPTCPPAFDLVASDLVALDEPLYHIARFLPSVKLSKSPFLLVFQLMLPCSPPLALCCCWEAPLHPERASLDELLAATRARDAQAPSGGSPEQLEASARAFWVGLRDWLAGDGVEADASRSRRLKLIPHIVRGSWVVKRAVGTTPVLLGQKLLTKYYRGPNYFEVDVDVTSNPVANSITGLVINAITSLVVDLAFLIEGQDERALPERLLGSIRYNHLRLKGCPYLQVDGEKGTIVRDGALEDRA